MIDSEADDLAMTVDWQEADGMELREEFKLLKGVLTPNEIRFLEKGPKTMADAWHLGSLHAEYKRLKKSQPLKLPRIHENKEGE